MKPKYLVCALMLPVFIGLARSSSYAVGSGGFANATFSPRSISLGFTGAANTADPSLAYYNPAGAVFLNQTAFQIGATGISFETKYSGASGSSKMNDSFSFPPFAYAVVPLGERLALSLGINSPFGLATEWDENSLVKYEATKSELKHVQVNPSVAFRITDKLAMNAGLVYAWSDATLEKKINVAGVNYQFFGVLAPAADGTSSMTGDDTSSWGYNIGMMLKPTETQRLGLHYRSRIKDTIEGEINVRGLSGAFTSNGGSQDIAVRTKADFPLPESLMIGHGADVGKWTFQLDGEYVAWGVVDGLSLNSSQTGNFLDDQLIAAGAQQSFDYHNTWNFGFGANYALTNAWDLRAGIVRYDLVGKDQTFTPAVPDAERFGPTLGFGYKSRTFLVDLGYSYTFAQDRTITTDEHVRGANFQAPGKYETNIHVVSLAFTQKFGGE